MVDLCPRALKQTKVATVATPHLVVLVTVPREHRAHVLLGASPRRDVARWPFQFLFPPVTVSMRVSSASGPFFDVNWPHTATPDRRSQS